MFLVERTRLLSADGNMREANALLAAFEELHGKYALARASPFAPGTWSRKD